MGSFSRIITSESQSMPRSQVHPNGWISVDIDEKFENHAKKIRIERDKIYGNIFSEKESDLRWVGDLGEIVFKGWLKHLGVAGVQWIVDDASGEPDFIIGSHRVGVKTVKRKNAPKPSYEAGMTSRHTEEPVESYFFMSYQFTERRMWLIGGISKSDFMSNATHYKAGDFVHPNYQIRPGHEIHNIDMSVITAPQSWLNPIVAGRQAAA